VYSPETQRIECSNDIGVPIFDVALGLSGLGFAAYTYDSLSDSQSSKESATTLAAPIVLFSAIAFGAAVYGFKMVKECNHAYALEREERVEAKAERKRRREAWGRAWVATQQAAAAARQGDCARVRNLEVFVRQLDEEFHHSVFKGDVAIARCIAPPAEAPAPPPQPRPPTGPPPTLTLPPDVERPPPPAPPP
jgi:hypothetical protein